MNLQTVKNRDKQAANIGARIDMCVAEQRRIGGLAEQLEFSASDRLYDALRHMRAAQASLEAAREALA